MIVMTKQELGKLAEVIKNHCGIRLGPEKQALVTGRLQQVLVQKGFQNFSEFFTYVAKDKTGEALRLLVDKITTNHTFFMREAQHFQYFSRQVLPYLAATANHKDLRVWSAGCSSGEEPYTLAMIMADYFGDGKRQWDTRILATDISSKVLEAATAGIYSNETLTELPENWKRNYFRKVDADHSRLVDSILRDVIIRKFNLMNPFPFKKKFHVIFCRNVMIYFDEKTKQELVAKFYEYTEPGGYLFIGHSESLTRESTRYRYVLPAIYRKE